MFACVHDVVLQTSRTEAQIFDSGGDERDEQPDRG